MNNILTNYLFVIHKQLYNIFLLRKNIQAINERPNMGPFNDAWRNMCWIIPEEGPQFLCCSNSKTSYRFGPEL